MHSRKPKRWRPSKAALGMLAIYVVFYALTFGVLIYTWLREEHAAQ